MSVRTRRVGARRLQTPDGDRKQGRAPSRIGDQNLRVTLEAVSRDGPLTRLELGSRTGLTGPGITNILRRLADDGLITARKRMERAEDSVPRIRDKPERRLQRRDPAAGTGRRSASFELGRRDLRAAHLRNNRGSGRRNRTSRSVDDRRVQGAGEDARRRRGREIRALTASIVLRRRASCPKFFSQGTA